MCTLLQVNKLAEIGGRRGSCKVQEAPKVGLKISDALFKVELLSQYSWTGRTKTDGTKKTFLKFENVHRLFFEVIKLACNDFSVKQNEHFFINNLLKHTKLRIERARK